LPKAHQYAVQLGTSYFICFLNPKSKTCPAFDKLALSLSRGALPKDRKSKILSIP